MTESDSSAALLDRQAIGRAFGRASSSYDSVAKIQAVARDELLSRLAHFKATPDVVLDLGAGTGLAGEGLRNRFPKASVIGIDLALPMLQYARERVRGSRSSWQRLQDRLGYALGDAFGRVFGVSNVRRTGWIAADASSLPLASNSVQVVFSNLMLQWCMPPDQALAEVRRVLAPDGLFLFSTFGPSTLRELREAWASVDEYPHVNDFIDMHDLGSALTRAGFSEPVLDIDRMTQEYTRVQDLLKDLKELGARNSLVERRRSLTGKSRLNKMLNFYHQRYAKRASWEIIYGSAFASNSNAPLGARADTHSAGGSSETRIPLEAIKRKAPPSKSS
jgi:malonyl-CoA O-methyltransferase